MANPRYMRTLVPKVVPSDAHHYTFKEAIQLLGDSVTLHPEGYATDNRYPDIHILPEDMTLDVSKQVATFSNGQGSLQTLRLKPNQIYVHPSGYKVEVNRHPTVPKWRLVGTLAEPTFCHKPSTVSGGGKSEISKSLMDAVIHGPIFIGDYLADMAQVESIFQRDYSDCLLPEYRASHSDPSRPILSPER